MKRFIGKILIFLIFIFCISLILDYVFSEGLKHYERINSYTMNKIMNDTIDADLIILGDSRATCSYNTCLLDSLLNLNSQNLGCSGQPFGIDYFRYSLYKSKNVKPKLILLNIDYMELDMYNSGLEREQYYPYVFNPQFKEVVANNNFTLMEQYLPLYRYRGNLPLIKDAFIEFINYKLDKPSLYDGLYDVGVPNYKGYWNLNYPWSDKFFREMISSGEPIMASHDSMAVSLLESFLSEVTKDSIPIVMVYAPLYIEVIPHVVNHDSVMSIYSSFADKYDIPILDYSKSNISKDTANFYNATHVNIQGATLFTKSLVQRIDSLKILE